MEKQGKCSTINEQAIVLLKKIMLGDITREFGIQHGLSSKGLVFCQEQLLAVASNLKSSPKLDYFSDVSVVLQEDVLVDVDPSRISAENIEIKEEPFCVEVLSCADQDNQGAKVKEEAPTEGDSHHGAAALNVMSLVGLEESLDDYRGLASNETNQKLHINHTKGVSLSTFKGEERFSCFKCSYSTNQKCNLQKHLKTHDVRVNKFACPFCSYKTHLKNKLTRHVPTHDADVEKNLLCGLCPYKTFCTDRLNQHLRRHYPAYSTRLSCSQCPYKTWCKAKLARHCLTHARDQAKRLTCPHCHYRTDGKGHLKHHLRTRHPSLTENSLSG